MKEQYSTEQQALDRVAEIDSLLGFPDSTGTLTYAIPTYNEEAEMWEIEVGSDVLNKESNEGVTEHIDLEATEQVGDMAE